MFGLQELFDKQIEEHFKPNKLGVRILESELSKIGINLTDAQRIDLQSQFLMLEKGSLKFDFDDKQLEEAKVSSEEELKPKIKLILDNLGNSIDKFSGKLDGMMEALVLDVVNSMGTSIRKTLEEHMEEMLEDQDSIRVNFDEGIKEVWGDALDLLQGLIVIADEAAQGYLKRSDQYSENDLVQDLLLRMHARANQIAKEIYVLLSHGFSDGAQARWRSLHELAVISSFISHHGKEVAIKFIEHESVAVYKAAKQYNEYHVRLGANKIDADEMAAIENDYSNLIEKYGKYYGHDYGWASEALDMKKPTFKNIEENVELDHVRPYYKAASAKIHSNPAGVFSSLGLFPEEDLLLAGPSGIGLSDPAQLTAITLSQITTSVLTYNTNIDFLVVCRAMAEYSKDVETAFITTESELHEYANA